MDDKWDGKIERAEFNELIRPYLVLYVAVVLSVTVVGIPLAVIWLMGIGQWWARHYFDKLECELTDSQLRFRKGILFQVEKTIPLENIQDVTFIEGPVLRRFHLSKLKFETAGQSEGRGYNMELIGIVNAHDFRGQILKRRQALKYKHTGHPSASVTPGPDGEQLAVLKDIRVRLDEIASVLRGKSSH